MRVRMYVYGWGHSVCSCVEKQVCSVSSVVTVCVLMLGVVIITGCVLTSNVLSC